MRSLPPLALALVLALALTQPLMVVAAQAGPVTPPTLALLAAVGDRIEFVRQLKRSSSKTAPYKRQTLQVSGQALNFAVLRGLDQALTEEEPGAQHVLLQWTMPDDVASRLAKARGNERQGIVLAALTEHLNGLAERQTWDRIEVIVPAYADLEMKGIGTKLSGIGVYVQPVERMDFDLDSMNDGSAAGSLIMSQGDDGDEKTVNPRTGETAHASTYVAPYMYFERLTFDAKSMALIRRERHFDNTKYADPDSTALDVASQMSNGELIGKLVKSVERSAYKAIHQTSGEVTVSEPKAVVAPGAAPGAVPRAAAASGPR
ncbi:hypothetical protein OU995_07175 [Roseateles sp. SL47]|uniref:hypothetical protein n=1 Tax=Roseateles sp. SL47 TaxID=2995138 RepID=UPI00226FDC2A|nr:hypothetical protein [Roseateles sp. SL47]WAC74492.1 hypothetical protein OU995_07175 [Roseateles sp. SL47]